MDAKYFSERHGIQYPPDSRFNFEKNYQTIWNSIINIAGIGTTPKSRLPLWTKSPHRTSQVLKWLSEKIGKKNKRNNGFLFKMT